VDEVDQNSRPKRTRVLRARDVIPPFDKMVLGADDQQADAPPAPTLPSRADDGGAGPADKAVPDAGGAVGAPPTADAVAIPTYNLAENILAEQRRTAGRRRRAPGRAEHEPKAPVPAVPAKLSLPDLTSPDLLELQRIVAEIVARDIERLCRRPDRPAYVGR
jgi:hypothetical protein